MSRSTSPEARADVVRLRAEGLTQVAIAARVGIGQSVVSAILIEAGRGGHLANLEQASRNERIPRLRDEGLTQAQIGAEVGLTQTTVGDILRRFDAAQRKAKEDRARACASRAAATQHDVLDAWADGLQQYGLHLLTGRSEAAIRQIVLRARRRGDERAVRRH